MRYLVLGAPHTGGIGDMVHGSFTVAMASEAGSGPELVIVQGETDGRDRQAAPGSAVPVPSA
ncbi:hypothetical protein [Breoghania sp.]|uniref:hypothetical protein n=1 Tax=Breoghania sp. TaxID=2065378 RepID=UPI002622D034|nr:hypothetical protein [Breoghania sp.]MDJ0931112.1 hypothetical protein [Breoghania sp.]